VTSLHDSGFAPRTVALLIVAGALTFAGAIYFIVFGDTGIKSGANSFSESAIGHKAFVELLRRQSFAVIVSQNDSAEKARDGALLVLAEPSFRQIDKQGGLPAAERTLLVLPKWRGFPDPQKPRWLLHAGLLPPDSVQSVLRNLLPEATLVRPNETPRWSEVPFDSIRNLRPGGSDNTPLWNRMRSRAAPKIENVQLINSSSLTPILASPEGILIGGMRVNSRSVFVISDPDLLSNHGLDEGENANHLVDAMTLFQSGSAPLIIDETIHGFRSNPNLWRKMFELPYIVATMLTAAAIVTLLWASTGRFGAPQTETEDHRVADIGLIETAVDLLYQSGQGVQIARRYPAVILRQVTNRLHTPRHLSEDAKRDWIDRVGDTRGVTTHYRDLQREIESATPKGRTQTEAVLRALKRLHTWKQEMLDGSGRHTSR